MVGAPPRMVLPDEPQDGGPKRRSRDGGADAAVTFPHLLQYPLLITYATHSTAMEWPPAKS